MAMQVGSRCFCKSAALRDVGLPPESSSRGTKLISSSSSSPGVALSRSRRAVDGSLRREGGKWTVAWTRVGNRSGGGAFNLIVRARNDDNTSDRVNVIYRPQAVNSDQVVEEESFSGGKEVLGPSETNAIPIFFKILQFPNAFWRFLRPHTIRGTVLGSTALFTRVLIENPQLIDRVLLLKAFRGLVALLCANGYIVGINQIYDVGIDKINKPFLPIAAEDFSIPVAWGLVLGLATLGIGIIGMTCGPPITTLYFLALFLGTSYSVPPLQLKRFPVLAFLIIASVRGFILNFGVNYATRAALGKSFEWNPSMVFITSFVTVFAAVIAITKDLHDVEGDRQFRISTFASRFGVRNITFLGTGLLLTNYVGAIVSAIYLPHSFNLKVLIPAHALLAGALVYQTWLLDSAKYAKPRIAGFYRFIWNLLYSEYTLLPFI